MYEKETMKKKRRIKCDHQIDPLDAPRDLQAEGMKKDSFHGCRLDYWRARNYKEPNTNIQRS